MYPPSLANVSAIAAGALHSLALLTNGTVIAWGCNGNNQTNVPSNLSNVVAVAGGGSHSLALKENGTVVAWGDNSYEQTNVPSGLSNVMAIAAGSEHSVAMKNDGTVVAWGKNTDGQINIPTNLVDARLIAAGGDHTLVARDSRLLEYPGVTAAKDLLLIYNANSLDSSNVCQYYLAHRPMVADANVCSINYAVQETVATNDFESAIQVPILTWLTNNPTKRPKYWILFLDVPMRIHWSTNGTNETYEQPPYTNSVSFQLSLLSEARNPIITHINMDGTNACRAYIDKLEFFGANYSPGKLIISAHAGGYGNTNYYFDGTRSDSGGNDSIANAAQISVLQAGAPSNSVFYTHVNPDPGLSGHITNGTNVAGYVSWGSGHSYLGYGFVLSNVVVFSGASEWFVMTTGESQNGWRRDVGQSYVLQWFSENAFGQSTYHGTPVGAVSHTDEPFEPGIANTTVFFGKWQVGKRFGNLAWRARQTPYFQAVGDPLTTR